MAPKVRAASPAVIEYAEAHKVDLATVAGSGPDGRVTLEDVKAAVPEPYVTPLVARLAAENSLDLRAIAGTGIGGRIRKNDVLRAAGKLPAASTVTDGDRQVQEIIAMFKDVAHTPAPAAGRSAAYARNPLVDTVRAQALAQHRPSPSGSVPTLFASGDLPTFTASGIPPQALLDVPWEARHQMAAAATPAEAYEIAASCQGSDAETTAQMLYGGHEGNADYRERVEKWQVASMSDDELYGSLFGGAKEELDRRETARDRPSEADAALIDDLIANNLGNAFRP